ncbi:MAG: nitroreductase family protein, partial [Prevotella sp.]|nr:nitroreductase family protein [Prevotella sp.]
MAYFSELLKQRRSYRRFSDEEISGDDVQMLLRAALMSPSSMNRQSWHFVVVDDKMALEKLS